MSYKTIPLSPDEKDLLHAIFVTRLRVLVSGFLLLESLFFVITLRMSFRRYKVDQYDLWDSQHIRHWTAIVFGGMLCLFFIIYCACIFFKRVYPFYKDHKCGEKEIVPYLITRKEYFPITNQYFIGFDDPKYRFHQVDRDFYNKCYEGGTAYLYRAEHSKYVFENNGRFTLL